MFKWGHCPKCGKRRRIVAETKPPTAVTISFECGHVRELPEPSACPTTTK